MRWIWRPDTFVTSPSVPLGVVAVKASRRSVQVLVLYCMCEVRCHLAPSLHCAALHESVHDVSGGIFIPIHKTWVARD